MTTESESKVSSMDSTIVRIVDNIKKSSCDSWNYRGLELSNGMLVVLISHPTIDKAAVALDVNTGSLADPKEYPGVAHFLEHMLFMGSEKYPGENEYYKLIEESGGYSNAFTGTHHTNYYFDINPSLLPEGLDIFAQFFISPLFASSSIDREVEAVNSEYEGYLFQDDWRIPQLEKSTSDPEHPYSGFNVGNTESLKTIPEQRGINIREILLKFYHTEYSSNRMSLAVVGNQSLDELQSLVIQSFKDVPNKNLPASTYPPDPYGEISRKTICFSVPVESLCRLSIKWVIPNYTELYYCNPNAYLGHLIGHESEGSLLAYLRKMGLAVGLMAGGDISTSGFNFFEVQIDLTWEAVEKWEEVVYIVYQYITMLRKEEPKEWIFDECKNEHSMNFQYQEKARLDYFVSHLAGRLRDYPLTECLSGPYELREFRPDLITEELNEYLIPRKMRIFLCGKTLESIAIKKEKWFGTSYQIQSLSEELLKKCETCEVIPELHLPLPNQFMPSDFRLFSGGNISPRPQLPIKVKENEFYRLFYAEDSFFKLPKVYIYLDFRYSLAFVDPFHMNLISLYTGLIDDALKDDVYFALLGGLTYTLTPMSYGFQLFIRGYNHQIKQFLDQIIDKIINVEVQEEKLELTKSYLRGTISSRHLQIPYLMAQYGISYLTDERRWSDDEHLNCVNDITIYDVNSFIVRFLSRFYIDSLMYGNLTKEQAVDYITSTEQKFLERCLHGALFPGMWFDNRILSLPEGCNYEFKRLNKGHQLNSIVIYFQCFEETLENNALMGFFCYLTHQPCFDQLRTKEQLGYVVSLDLFPLHNIQGLTITVQTSRELDYVNERVELFLHSIKDFLSTMSDESFEKQRQGYMEKRAEVEKEMKSQGDVFWDEITTHRFCFDRPQLEIERIKLLKRDDILRFYDYYISPHSTHRRKLAIYVTPAPATPQPKISEKDAVKIKDIVAIWTGKKLPSTKRVRHAMSVVTAAGKIRYRQKKLMKQPSIIDIIIRKNLKEAEKILPEKEIILPEIKWIDNVPVWKSKLPCYPLAQPYQNIDVLLPF